MNVCKSIHCDLKKEEIEMERFFNSIKIDDLKFKEDSRYDDRLNILRTSFGETLLNDNHVEYSINLSINEWKEEGRASFIKKLVEELNLNCGTRKAVKNLEFLLKSRGDNAGYIILDALNHMKHENTTRIFFPVGCFTYLSDKYSVTNGNIFNGFPNLTELSLTCSKFWQ
uniref:Ankyrin repeat protein n=1 Tax=Strongyloides venezuelensis TaxID=75913 RepID=A0A0K0EWI0_STRVS